MKLPLLVIYLKKCLSTGILCVNCPQVNLFLQNFPPPTCFFPKFCMKFFPCFQRKSCIPLTPLTSSNTSLQEYSVPIQNNLPYVINTFQTPPPLVLYVSKNAGSFEIPAFFGRSNQYFCSSPPSSISQRICLQE